MANKEFKDLDVKLHNFINEQKKFNHSVNKVFAEMEKNNSIIYHGLILPEIERQRPKLVCMSAIK